MRRHLPLVRAVPSAPSEPRELVRTRIPRAVAIADTSDGGEALAFAGEVAEALASSGQPSALLLLGYDSPPTLPAPLRARLAPFAPRASTVDEVVLPEGFAILVGCAALAGFAAPLSILIGAARPLSAWPSELRRLRALCALELPGPDERIARALAERLLQSGFLR